MAAKSNRKMATLNSFTRNLDAGKVGGCGECRGRVWEGVSIKLLVPAGKNHPLGYSMWSFIPVRCHQHSTLKYLDEEKQQKTALGCFSTCCTILIIKELGEWGNDCRVRHHISSILTYYSTNHLATVVEERWWTRAKKAMKEENTGVRSNAAELLPAARYHLMFWRDLQRVRFKDMSCRV